MTLHISESDVRAVLTMPMAIEAVEEISRKQATGEVVLHPRRRFEFPGGRFFHHMAAADLDANRVATKQYTYVNGKLKFVVSLYSMETGDLLALIEGDCLSQQRTGAASGVATKYMGRSDARTAAIIGTGWQAQAQLEAIAAVRNLESAVVYGRDDARREEFALEIFDRAIASGGGGLGAGFRDGRGAMESCFGTVGGRLRPGPGTHPARASNAIQIQRHRCVGSGDGHARLRRGDAPEAGANATPLATCLLGHTPILGPQLPLF